MLKRFRLPPAALICTLLICSGLAHAAGVSRNFAAETGGGLTLRADGASISVQGGANDEFHVEITRGNDDAATIEKDYRIEFQADGNLISGEIKRRKPHRGWFSRGLKIAVTLPASFDLDLDTSGGDVSVSAVAGEIKAATSGGNLSFEQVSGPVTGDTSGGSIHLESTIGNADLKTSGGNITIGTVDGNIEASTSGGNITVARGSGSVTAKTSGGNIGIDEVYGVLSATTSGGNIRAYIVEQPEADCRLTASGGSITVTVDPLVALTLEARASGGSIETELPVTVRGKLARSRLEGDINGGGPLLYIRSSGGSIRLQEPQTTLSQNSGS